MNVRRGLVACGLVAAVLLPAMARAASGARMFANEDLIFYKPQPGDRFGGALATGDFNGDGADDLATGIPFQDGIFGFEKVDVGAVVVRFGALASGFPPGHVDEILNQLAGGSPDPGEPDDRFGWALAACDFNGDGFDDLAVGIPFEDGGEVNFKDSGAVEIHYGSSTGLETVAEQFFAEGHGGIPGEQELGDQFGEVLACGDLDGDGFADLAIGVPEERIEKFSGDADAAGMVVIVPGSEGGLVAADATALTEDGLGFDSEFLDEFGYSLAIGYFDEDGYADLAVGAPGEEDFGAVFLLHGGAGGVSSPIVIDESDFGEVRDEQEHFGSALAFGDFDHDLFADLAIGTPHEHFQTSGFPSLTIADNGQVAVLYGAESAPYRHEVWTQLDVIGSVGGSDLFGFALAGGDLDGDGFDDLAFGRALATGDFDGDHCADLTIGIPNQDAAAGANVGAEMVIHGGLLSDGFESGLLDQWTAHLP